MEFVEKVVNFLKNFTPITLFILILNIALGVVFWELWNSNRALFWGGLVIYAVVLGIGSYIWKAWGAIEGETIAQFVGFLRKSAREFRPGFPRRYKEEVINRHRFFNTKGLRTKAGTTPELQQVFIELEIDASHPQEPPTNPLALRLSDNKGLIWNHIAQLKQQPLKALAVIGPPGCGKSTLLQYVALALAGNRQHQYRIQALTPLLLFLRDHIKPIVEGKVTLAELAQLHFGNVTLYPDLQPPQNWFAGQLQKGQMLVLLDGLDEVSNVEERKKVSVWVDKQIANYPKCCFILTARPQGYRDAPLEHAKVLKVQPLNSTQVSAFIQNWYLATKIIATGKNDKGVRQDAKRDAQDLLQRLRERPNLNDLTVNPLLLTMMAIVHNHRAVLPGQRVELYAEICDVFLEHWQAARHIPDRLSAAQKREALEPLATYMMKYGGADHNRRTLSTAEVLEIIKPYLVVVGLTEEEQPAFLKNLNDNSGIFTEAEVGEWGFTHKTFQEYLCATYWRKHPESAPMNWGDLIEDVWWQETLLLYAAQADATPLANFALARNTLESLTFAASLDEEALKLEPEVRETIRQTIEGNLNSVDSDLRRLAVEVMLHRRLKSNFVTMDEARAIDKDFISCAEYQLFISERKAEGFRHQPFHWRTEDFAENGLSPTAPIVGIGITDALFFCKWLSERTGKSYRLPSLEEVKDTPKGLILELTLDLSVKENPNLSKQIWDVFRKQDFVIPLTDDPISLTSIADACFVRRRESIRALKRDLDRDDARERSLSRLLMLNLFLVLTLSLLEFALPRLLIPMPIALSIVLDLARLLAAIRSIYISLTYNRAPYHTHDGDFAFKIGHELEVNLAVDANIAFHLIFERDHRNHPDYINWLEQMESKVSEVLSHFNLFSHQRILNLILVLIKIAKAQDNPNSWQESWKYHQQIFQYGYEWALLREKEHPKFRWRFWEKDRGIESAKEAYSIMYWFYTLLLARQAGELPAWEGIRLVREDKMPE